MCPSSAGREWSASSVHRMMLILLLASIVYGIAARALDLASHDVETEYMPPEILTRGIYAFAVPLFVSLAFDATGSGGFVVSPSVLTGDRMPSIVPAGVALGAALMIMTENNWDLDQRESVAGTLLFAAAFIACLFPFFVRALRRLPLAALLTVTGALLLFFGEVIDHTDALPKDLSEEGFETVGGIAMLWSLMLFALAERGPVTSRLLLTEARWRLILGTALFSLGNAMLMFNHRDCPPAWQLFEGVVLTTAGIVILHRTVAEAIRLEVARA